MKRGILFDLDGTLLDTLADLLDATNYALAEFGFPARTIGEVRSFVGNGAETLIRLALPEGTDPAYIPKVLAVYKPYYTANCRIKTHPYPGIPEALEVLKQEYPIAIVSNKPDAAVKELCAQYFPGIFAMGESPDCPRKPAPDMVCRAMEAIGVETCIYVGDSEVDVLTAKNAGVPCLSVLWGFRDREVLEANGGLHFCEAGEDLPNAIRKIAGRL